MLEWDDRIPSFDEVHNEALKAIKFQAAARNATLREVRSAPICSSLQRAMASAIFRPLTRAGGCKASWTDGRNVRAEASEFIKPNDRLTSFERLEIYNRVYWFRVLDCLYDDYPGLRAVLGERNF